MSVMVLHRYGLVQFSNADWQALANNFSRSDYIIKFYVIKKCITVMLMVYVWNIYKQKTH